MHYFITGHTGFKGAWLAMWLASEGHEVSGLALNPAAGSLFELARVSDLLVGDHRVDIRDLTDVMACLQDAQPDVIVHLAAQPIVRRSYEEPRMTYETNVLGTLNLLEASDNLSSVRARLLVTTDKVYRNCGQAVGYVEEDPLGGSDPYSGSKAMMELLAHSWTQSFIGPPTALARAGNVIGGGDVSSDRLLPDIVRSLTSGSQVVLRYPDSVRPWQHVLDCLNGYRLLIARMLDSGSFEGGAGAWNFGPDEEASASVSEVTRLMIEVWGSDSQWIRSGESHPREEALLKLDSRKAVTELDWMSRLDLEHSVAWTAWWHKLVNEGVPPREVSLQQINEFVDLGA